MKTKHATRCFGAIFTVMTAANVPGARAADSAAINGSGAALGMESRSPKEIYAELTADQATVNAILGKDNAAMKTSASRDAAAPRLLPLLRRTRADVSQLATALPPMAEQLDGAQIQLLALQSALGDKIAIDQINAMVASNDPAQAARGQAHLLMARFYVTPNSTDAMTALTGDVEKADRATPASVPLTQTTIEMGHEAPVPVIRSRLLDIAANDMDNPVAGLLRENLNAKKEADAQDAQVANKPITLAGTLAGGQPFSTASLKGKVVLVDFWATWCGPCKAELPRVKKVYADYHKQGLEVIGVSNDYDVSALTSFVLNEQMLWPELFDSKAAAEQEWNPITVGQKIIGIPVVYLIDKKGVLRTVNARDSMEELIPRLLAEPS